jgi:nucleoside-diphosphate-sugar epimerase
MGVVSDDFAFIRETSNHWTFLCGKTVVVTGAAGFLPAYLVEFLLALPEPPRIIGIVRDRNRALERFIRYADSPYLDLRQAVD